MKQLPRPCGCSRPPSGECWSAKWIDANPPAHAADELPLGMELGADRFYSIGSSFVHGFKWMTDYICDDEATLKVVAEGFAAAVVMTECAVCLFEAPATNAARAAVRRANYPDWLAPTVAAWLPRYLSPLVSITGNTPAVNRGRRVVGVGLLQRDEERVSIPTD